MFRFLASFVVLLFYGVYFLFYYVSVLSFYFFSLFFFFIIVSFLDVLLCSHFMVRFVCFTFF